jgi:glutamine synthetase
MPGPAARAAEYRRRHPDPARVDLLVPDLAGRVKGRRLAADRLESACAGEETIGPRHLGAEQDGPALPCRPVAGPAPVPWSSEVAAQILCAPGDPAWDTRAVLERQAEYPHGVERFEARIELYLFQEGDAAAAPRPLSTASEARGALDALGPADAIWTELLAASESQALGIAGIESAQGDGRYRLRLAPDSCPIRLADRILLVRRAVAGIAAWAGAIASFMPMPFTAADPSRMIFRLEFADSRAAKGAAAKLAGGPGSALALHAANANAFRLFAECAPVAPETDGRTLSHGLSGADANPYLALAAILDGIKSPESDISTVPISYERALDLLAESPAMRVLLRDDLHENLLRQRLAEQARLAATIRPLEYLWYLHTV